MSLDPSTDYTDYTEATWAAANAAGWHRSFAAARSLPNAPAVTSGASDVATASINPEESVKSVKSVDPSKRLARIEIDHTRNGALAHTAERYAVSSKHDAVGLWPVVAARFVQRTLERADVVRVRT